MALQGTYFFYDLDPNWFEEDRIEEFISSRYEESYYRIEQIIFSPDYIVDPGGEKTMLQISVTVYKDKESRNNFFIPGINELMIIGSFTIPIEIDKEINTGKIWEYCYTLSKPYIIEKLELELKTYKEQYKEIIVLEDV